MSKRLETRGGEALLLLLWPEEKQEADDRERPVTSVMQHCACVCLCV